ncbi:MAG: protein kinase [Deltaproteobacteria bacterium]|nr:protein kinase [Deltaproteobacteria bacterium]
MDFADEPVAGFKAGELIRRRYEVVKLLGAGRLGTVLKVTDAEVGIEAALKVVHRSLIPDEAAGRSFMVGMRALIPVKHEGMARIFDVNCDGDRYFVVSQLLDGVPLRRLMEGRRARGQDFSLTEIVPVVQQVVDFLAASGLAAHGDLAPENIWILPRHIKVSDAGLAVHLPPAAVSKLLRSSGRSRGYAAPEMARGAPPDGRSDVYALGVLVGEMTTHVAFDGRPESFFEAEPDLDAGLDEILRRAVDPDPRQRHPAPLDLLADLVAVASAKQATDGANAFEDTNVDPLPPAKDDDDVEILEVEDENPVDTKVGPASPVKPPPRVGPGFEFVSDPTAQVSMEDVIRAHVEGIQSGPKENTPLPLQRKSAVAPPMTPLPGLKRRTLPPPPPSASPPAAKRPAAARPTVPPPPPPRRTSAVPPPPAPPAKPRIAPKRPESPVMEPRPARMTPAPTSRRADEPLQQTEEEPTSAGVHRAAPRSSVPKKRREVTQEIDIEALEAVAEVRRPPRREVTEQIDLDMIESVERISTNAAVAKLERTAADAERSSAEELIRRARALDGVDPRLVRAAHALESDRRGGRSKQAAELLRQRADELEGIDPRLLRAAARLEEARISSVPPTDEDHTELQDEDDDWRERLGQAEEQQVISFLAPPMVKRDPDVRGFPHNQQRGAQPRPPTEPPHRSAPRTPRRRDPQSHQVLYDDSGEADRESRPTIPGKRRT